MKTNFINFLMAITISFSATLSFADSVRDGGMSGGGGGSTPADPVTEDDVLFELRMVRQELYLYFNTLSMYENSLGPVMDQIKDKILPIIENVPIHASSVYCLDKFGNPKDGSIYSPHGNAICITVKNMVNKLRQDNVKTQIAALVAHEYAHLAGLGEADAVAVQDWIVSSFSRGTGGDGSRLLQNAVYNLVGIDAAIFEASRNASWNTFCYAAEKIEREHSALSVGSVVGVLNLFDLPSSKMNNSFFLKNLLLRSAACGFSDYHPERNRHRQNYENDFGNYPERSDSEMESAYWNTKGLVSGKVMMKKVVTLADGMSELRDIQKYTKEASDRIKMIKDLDQSPLR
ncbi:hypothetical protein D3C87_1080760 [compost metagenome]